MQLIGSEPTITSVAVSGTSAVLAPTSGDRKYLIIWNQSGQDLYVAMGATAAATDGNYTVIVSNGTAYEVPGIYQGPVSGITASGSGNVNVTVID
jgi:hypothetical protein